jgi:hypothetical protein
MATELFFPAKVLENTIRAWLDLARVTSNSRRPRRRMAGLAAQRAAAGRLPRWSTARRQTFLDFMTTIWRRAHACGID